MELEQAYLICPKCKTSDKKYLNSTSNSVSYGEEVDYCTYSYKRSVYFKEYLIMFQYKEANQVKLPLMKMIMLRLYQHGFKNSSEITMEDVNDVVRELKLDKLYKQITQIWCRITNNPPPRLTNREEEFCCLRFNDIQEPYARHLPRNV